MTTKFRDARKADMMILGFAKLANAIGAHPADFVAALAVAHERAAGELPRFERADVAIKAGVAVEVLVKAVYDGALSIDEALAVQKKMGAAPSPAEEDGDDGKDEGCGDCDCDVIAFAEGVIDAAAIMACHSLTSSRAVKILSEGIALTKGAF